MPDSQWELLEPRVDFLLNDRSYLVFIVGLKEELGISQGNGRVLLLEGEVDRVSDADNEGVRVLCEDSFCEGEEGLLICFEGVDLIND